jgi:hypothetical protein
MTAPGRLLPRWAYEILMSPQTRSPLTEQQGRLIAPDGEMAGAIVEGPGLPHSTYRVVIR